MNFDVAFSFGHFSFLSRYGRLLSLEETWDDGALVWGFICCDCCKQEVDRAVLVNGQYHCENCLEEKI